MHLTHTHKHARCLTTTTTTMKCVCGTAIHPARVIHFLRAQAPVKKCKSHASTASSVYVSVDEVNTRETFHNADFSSSFRWRPRALTSELEERVRGSNGQDTEKKTREKNVCLIIAGRPQKYIMYTLTLWNSVEASKYVQQIYVLWTPSRHRRRHRLCLHSSVPPRTHQTYLE